ncbi:TKL protein kinase [Saprolegnia diclina VS20]|uniref:TKL protein kinase n=1 Tax=Saprolegnia diclina (strain VS20) TaxID=1156394 RepID=T0S4N4_SAPDV|nr:TKL protein kinase [Saprolegnia diclina VS20]EQC37702.1 TKL protein kinase [Saprolegnia diclina VS20]|eukprot:XP_008608635.1 TKL protein kinase [Saprolegnia diclina VS20]
MASEVAAVIPESAIAFDEKQSGAGFYVDGVRADSTAFPTLVGVLSSPPGIVCEYMGLGDLESYLHALQHPSSLLWPAQAHIAWSVATAVSYLHNYGLAHNRLCPKHILLSANFDVKLCGLSGVDAEDDDDDEDVRGLGRVLHAMRTRATALAATNCLFHVPPTPTWLLTLATACVNGRMSIADVVDVLERHGANDGVVYENQHHQRTLRITKCSRALLPAPTMAASVAPFTPRASLLEPSTSLDDLLSHYRVATLDAGLLTCGMDVDGTDGDVVLRRGTYDGHSVAVHQARQQGALGHRDLLDHVARLLAVQCDTYMPRVLGVCYVPQTSLLGCEPPPPVPCLVVDRRGLRSLRDVLAECPPYAGPFYWRLKLWCAHNIIACLAHLHALGVCHMNLTSHNVLVDGTFRPRLTNVGVALTTRLRECVTLGTGASRWYPPEVFLANAQPTSAMDVFAFGTLLYELETHKQPHESIVTDHALATIISGGTNVHVSADCPSGLAQLAADCMRQDPTTRPSPASIVRRLYDLLHPSSTLDMPGPASVVAVDSVALQFESIVEIDDYMETFRCRLSSELVWIKRPTTQSTKGIDVDTRARFFDEVSLLLRLQSVQSPHIVKLIGVANMAAFAPAMVIEYPPLGSLREFVLQHTLSVVDKLYLLLGVAQGLDDLHRRGWIHGDVCSESVFLGAHRQPKLGRLGAARHVRESSSFRHLSRSAQLYAAPEVLSAQAYSKASDIYAFGVLMCEVDTATTPLEADTTGTSIYPVLYRVKQGTLTPRPSPGCTPMFRALANHCMTLDQSKRPTTEKIVAALQRQIMACAERPTEKLLARCTHEATSDDVAAAGLPSADHGQLVVSRDMLLGTGSYAVVVRCSFKDEPCALKQLLPGVASDRHNRTKFLREMRLLASLQSPRVVSFRGTRHVTSAQPSFVMELVAPGENLRDWLQRSPAPSWRQRCRIALGLIEAIAYLHIERSMVHLDIKSHNIMVLEDGRVKLVDFGEARTLAEATPETVMGAGTIQWMAPELHYSRGDIGALTKADIYSFGVVLSELDTLQVPFSDRQFASAYALWHAVARDNARPQMSASSPAWFLALAKRCMDRDPGCRPDAASIRTALTRRVIADTTEDHLCA